MKVGVLAMAYGGPNSLEDVEPYLLDIRGHRPTPPSIVAEVRSRYERIGGASPILAETTKQAKALGEALERYGYRYQVFVGMRHWHPYIRDTVADMEEAGVTHVVGVVMAPHFSKLSVGVYRDLLHDSARTATVACIEAWHLLPGYVTAICNRVRAAATDGDTPDGRAEHVVFTAHSLPERIREWQDPYPTQLSETVTALQDRLPEYQCHLAYQSAGRTDEPWLGPTVVEVLSTLQSSGEKHVIIAPIGFTSEHVETLYDLDIELRAEAERIGVQIQRVPVVGADPTMIDGLAEHIVETVGARWEIS